MSLKSGIQDIQENQVCLMRLIIVNFIISPAILVHQLTKVMRSVENGAKITAHFNAWNATNLMLRLSSVHLYRITKFEAYKRATES